MKHNIFFDGKVQSLGFNCMSGYATVGVITPGEYTFNTTRKEHVIIVEGTIVVTLAHSSPQSLVKGDSYKVGKNQSFQVSCIDDAAYICYFFD